MDKVKIDGGHFYMHALPISTRRREAGMRPLFCMEAMFPATRSNFDAAIKMIESARDEAESVGKTSPRASA